MDTDNSDVEPDEKKKGRGLADATNDDDFLEGLMKPGDSDDNGALALIEHVLSRLGIPKYGMAKYLKPLQENYLTHIEQLYAMDANDWKRLGLPYVIEDAIRKALNQRMQMSATSKGKTPSGKRAGGLQLKIGPPVKPNGAGSATGTAAGGSGASGTPPGPASVSVPIPSVSPPPGDMASSTPHSTKAERSEPAAKSGSSSDSKRKVSKAGEKKKKGVTAVAQALSDDDDTAADAAIGDGWGDLELGGDKKGGDAGGSSTASGGSDSKDKASKGKKPAIAAIVADSDNDKDDNDDAWNMDKF